MNAKQHKVRAFVTLTVFAAMAGCAAHNESPDWRPANVQTSPEGCLANLGRNRHSQQHELVSSNIRMVNWNIQKGGDPDWADDLSTFTNEPDLMIFQEATLDMDAWALVGSGHHRSFAPGYRTPGAAGSVTGVMTLSAAEPLTSCSLISIEPWLRSPKASMITEYGLTDTDQSLLVVNIHAINFTFGNKDFREQVRRALSVTSGHLGPILLSGDFNTWHWRQSKILREMANKHGLTMLNYDVDHRKRVFGQPLDHIFVRGLRVIDATSISVDSSDHNPMSVTLSL
jgi:endonuclease/exonuclease/phosphatase (EEP) superfamily protein YafD